MGLNIDGLHVQVDHTHNRLLNTGRHGNPTVKQIPHPSFSFSLTVYSTFQRLKTPASVKRGNSLGDNCHLLYALKGKDGLKTTLGDIRQLLLNFDAILEDMMMKTEKYDVVIAMPSSHNISKIYAARLARKYQCTMLDDVFQKITVTDAQKQLQRSSLSSPDKSRIDSRLKKQATNGQTYFSLKDIPIDFREYFSPLIIKTQGINNNYQKILLADDLLSTGTTLLAGKRLILKNIPSAIIDASCLFSAV